ncbi:MAG: hypothetical protein GY828_05245 [Candidatus Gracilibacteria bacterium]|nr:hypothetical protein [Candidatus Gracilibacteria bacterium]
MKYIQNLLLLLLGLFLFFSPLDSSSALSIESPAGGGHSVTDLNLQTGGENSHKITNDKLDNFEGSGSILTVGIGGEEQIESTLIKIAKDLKNVLYIIASLYFLILLFRFLFSEKTEEGATNLKKGVLWISLGIIVMQAAYAFINTFKGEDVSKDLGEDLAQNILEPIIKLLETGASIFFIAIAIFAFYKLVTSGGNEEDATSGKMSILYAIGGFIIVKITRTLVDSLYGKVKCESSSIGILESNNANRCIEKAELSDTVQIIINIINWANGFIAIIVVILIIFAGSKVLLSSGNEDTLKSAKSSILFIAIGIGVLVMNYLILTFFLIPETPIG